MLKKLPIIRYSDALHIVVDTGVYHLHQSPGEILRMAHSYKFRE